MSSPRNSLERTVYEQVKSKGLEFGYETEVLMYTKPASKYTLDFFIKTKKGTVLRVETKGRWESADRTKHLLIKQQNPGTEVRFVFSNSRKKIGKSEKSLTYGQWCDKYGFKYADKLIPEEWFDE